ncbi:MAG: hypothetical protein EP343_16500 [Deltaproteobacteria bacterium]|nr:MAG: hypothetical protein EP343_16500 [Deltaproteobacteria bacterium]
MKWSPTRIFAVVLTGLLLTSAIFFFRTFAEKRHEKVTDTYHQMYYLPSSEVLQRLSIGYENFLADLIWIRGLLYVGEHFSTKKGKIDWLPRYAQAVIDLDPKFRYAYVWAAILVVYNRKKTVRQDILHSISFLKQGQKQFPHDYYFPYSLAMSYLSELTLGREPMRQLVADFDEFCGDGQKPLLQVSKANLQWQQCLDHPAYWLNRPACHPEAFVQSSVGFLQELANKRKAKRVPFIRQIKRCLRKKAALYLMDAASKEGAPDHYAPLAARILRRDGKANAAICNHLLDVIWRAESDEVRNKIRKRLRRFCGGERPTEIICQEEQFSRRWRKSFGYLPRSTYQMLDLPGSLTQSKPMIYPIPKPKSNCTYQQ